MSLDTESTVVDHHQAGEEPLPVTISADVATFLRGLLGGLTLNTGSPDFAETARLVVEAQRQLAD